MRKRSAAKGQPGLAQVLMPRPLGSFPRRGLFMIRQVKSWVSSSAVRWQAEESRRDHW